GKGLVGAATAERSGNAGESGAEREDLEAIGRLGETVSEAQRAVGLLLHGAGDIDQQQHSPSPLATGEGRKLQQFAIPPHSGAQAAAHIQAAAPLARPETAGAAMRKLAGRAA